MAEVKARGNVRHDGQEFAKGDVFEVSDSQADELVEAGAVVRTSGSKQDVEEPEDEGSNLLPDKFVTPEGTFTTKLNSKGVVSSYQLDGQTIKKSEYQAAYSAAESAGNLDQVPPEE